MGEERDRHGRWSRSQVSRSATSGALCRERASRRSAAESPLMPRSISTGRPCVLSPRAPSARSRPPSGRAGPCRRYRPVRRTCAAHAPSRRPAARRLRRDRDYSVGVVRDAKAAGVLTGTLVIEQHAFKAAVGYTHDRVWTQKHTFAIDRLAPEGQQIR